jgi:acetylornithine/N-succinyldiaminopimelate aminotransferase
MTLAERGTAAILPTYPPRERAFVRGSASSLWDEDGIEYLDLVAGLAVVALGHAHPAPIRALAHQAGILGHVSNLYWTEPAIRLAERLAALSGLTGGVFFCNSGAEANEAAIKLARRHGHATNPAKHEIICLDGAFHGRTLGALSATSGERKRLPFEPLLDGFVRVAPNDHAALRAAVSSRTAAILAEPVQGEGGVWPLDAGYLALARDLADRHDAMLILDEVQTGIGRCGAWFAFQRLGVTPDAVTLAKGLGSGLPVGALICAADANRFAPGDHASTFGGCAPIMAAALAVLDTIDQERLVEHADQLGTTLVGALRRLPGVRDVRGLGLLLAVELADGDAAAVAARLADDEHVLVNAVSDTALRLCPPLVLTAAEAERAVAAIGRVLAGSA